VTTLNWGRSNGVRIVVTTVGTDGAERRWIGELHAGRDKAETIKLPAGTHAVTIERPRRIRVYLGQNRRRSAPSRPARPTWRDDSSLYLWWRTWLAQRDARRTVRHQQKHHTATHQPDHPAGPASTVRGVRAPDGDTDIHPEVSWKWR
jgi:hypothetical protein